VRLGQSWHKSHQRKLTHTYRSNWPDMPPEYYPAWLDHNYTLSARKIKMLNLAKASKPYSDSPKLSHTSSEAARWAFDFRGSLWLIQLAECRLRYTSQQNNASCTFRACDQWCGLQSRSAVANSGLGGWAKRVSGSKQGQKDVPGWHTTVKRRLTRL